VRTIAILPVKSFGSAKQRLAGLLAGGSRQALAQAMFCDVLAALRHVPALDAIAVVTGDRFAEATAAGHGAQVLRDDVQAGQSPAALIGIRHAMAAGFERALLVPGDTPILDPADLTALLEDAEERELAIVVVPDRHGTGTNALLLAPPAAIEPSFGEGSFERHLAAARAAGLPHAVEQTPSLLLDVDTPDDLAELSAQLEQRRGKAPLTRGALAQLGRSRVSGPSVSRRREDAPVAPA
jgi:2-phospho-L-lactate/phosphoenolpyruvate guanylyltransferase